MRTDTLGPLTDTPQRIYVIVPRELRISRAKYAGAIVLPDGTEHYKLCMTSGRIASYVAHAVLKMEEQYSGALPLWDQDIIVLSVATSAALDAITADLRASFLTFSAYFDTDKLWWHGEMLGALCTFPVSGDRLYVPKFLRDLSPWRCACNELAEQPREAKPKAIGT